MLFAFTGLVTSARNMLTAIFICLFVAGLGVAVWEAVRRYKDKTPSFTRLPGPKGGKTPPPAVTSTH